MNLLLQDPFTVAKEYPETLVHTFQHGHSVTIQFNKRGDYLASGLSDGTILIYDLVSLSVIALLSRNGHVRPVTSIRWSSCGRYLLLASQDWHCILWDLSKANVDSVDDENPAIVRKVRFDGPVWLASIHPNDHLCFAASLFEDDPVYVNLHSGVEIQKLAVDPMGEKVSEAKDKHRALVTVYEPHGEYLFQGTSKGWLNIISVATLETVHLLKITNSNIKTLDFAPNGRKLAVNSSDRVIRQVNMPDLVNNKDAALWEFDVEHKYQDVVNRLQWNAVAFSHNLEFLVASTFGQSSQDLYVWETLMGSLIKILEGLHEELFDVKWNHKRCTIGATGLDSGSVYLWLVLFPLKWSALAPDFSEVEENEEYEEKEDEFDIVDEVDLMKRRMEEEDGFVDIVTKETTDARGFDMEIESFVIPINYARLISRG